MGRMTRRVARNLGGQRPAAAPANRSTVTAEPEKKPNLFQRAVGWLNKSRTAAR